jgi:hypothetical protein
MVFAYGVCFLVPVVLAATGAIWSGPALAWQICGASMGLVAGVLMAVVTMRFIITSKEQS